MARIALALFAIIVLALSAGVAHPSLQSPNAVTSGSLRAFEPRSAMSAQLAAPRELRTAAALQIPDDAPQPALIAYLSLVVIGSVIAVGMLRYRERG